MAFFCVYLLQHSLSGRSYVGITTDVVRRLRQHNGELTGGAKATTRFGSGWQLKHSTDYMWTRADAMRHERWVKKARGCFYRSQRMNTLVEDYRGHNHITDKVGDRDSGEGVDTVESGVESVPKVGLELG